MNQKNPILLGSILGVIGLLGITGFSAADFGSADTKTSMDSGALIGHITLVAYDPLGNIKHYVQTDNLVTDQGEACALKSITGATTAATDCISTPGTFNVLALGIGTTAADPNDTKLESETAATGLTRATATSVSVANDATGTAGAIATYTHTFTRGVIGGTTSVSEAGIFNSTSTSADGLFARQVFTAIPLGDNDQLALTWTVTFDG